MGGLPLSCFFHAGVAELRRPLQCRRGVFPRQQRPAQGGGEHVPGAVEGPLHPGVLDGHRPLPQPGQVADLPPPVYAGDDDVLHPQLLPQGIQQLLRRGIRGKPGQQSGLGAVGGDHMGHAAQLPHFLHLFRTEAAIQRPVITQNRVYQDQGAVLCKPLNKAPGKVDLRPVGKKSGVDAVKFQPQCLPLGGKLLHLPGEVPHNVPRKGRLCRQHRSGQRNSLHSPGRHHRGGHRQGALAKARQVIQQGRTLHSRAIDRIHSSFLLLKYRPTSPAARSMIRASAIRMAAMAKATSNSPCSLA